MSGISMLILLAVLLVLLVKIFCTGVTPNIRCPNCNYVGRAKYFIKGNIFIELVLWLCFIVPGLIYSIWLGSSGYYGCPKCRYQYVVKLNGLTLHITKIHSKRHEVS